jgi:hypothetical protein
MIGKNNVILFLAIVCFLGFALLARNANVDALVGLQFDMIRSMFMQETLSLNVLWYLVLSTVFLTLGYVFLCISGVSSPDFRPGLIVGTIASAVFLIMFNFSMVSLFLSAGMLITCAYIMPLSNTYFLEFKRWKLFRVGSNSIGKVLMILNVLVAVGSFVYLSGQNTQYGEAFKQQLSDTLKQISLQQAISNIDKQYPFLTPDQKQEIIDLRTQQIEAQDLTELGFLDTYITWLPLTTAATIWFVLEFLRTFVLSNLAGLFSWLLLKTHDERK